MDTIESYFSDSEEPMIFYLNAAESNLLSYLETHTKGKILRIRTRSSLVIGNRVSRVFGLERLIPSSIFLTTNFCVGSSKSFTLLKKLIPDKKHFIVEWDRLV